jgi:hypothetical protein
MMFCLPHFLMKSFLSYLIAFAILLFSLSANGKVIYVNGAMPAGGGGAS